LRDIARLTTFRPDDGGPSEVSDKPPRIVEAAQRRLRELDFSMRSGQDDRIEVAAIVSELMATYGNKAAYASPADAVAGFVGVLEGLPVWAIRAAAIRWTQGRCQNQHPGWPPSVDELYQAAATELGPVAEERRTLKQFLDGKAPQADAVSVRDKIGSGFDALAAELKATAVSAKSKEKAISRELMDRANKQSFDAECEAHGMAGSNISPSLARILQDQKEQVA